MVAIRQALLLAAALPAVGAAQRSSVLSGDLTCSPDAAGGLCSAADASLAREHQLLQLNMQQVTEALEQSGQRVRRAPGEFNCRGMEDVELPCSSNGCKVLATNMRGKTCKEYCARDSRECVGAWEEVDETCSVLAVMQCDQTWGTTSDLICECSSTQSVVASPGAERKDPSELKLVWSDEFDGGAVDLSKWTPVNAGGGFGNNEAQFYSGYNAAVSEGILKITAKCEEHRGQHFTSAKLETKHKADWGPGHRVDVRARLPTGKGTWPAIWMLPTDNSYGRWPKSGEIDIVETVGCTANKVYGTVHTEAYNHMLHTEKSNSKHLDFGAWHTYSIEWTGSQISWYVDDTLYHSFAPSSHSHDKWPYDRQFYLILNVAVGGSWGGYCLHGRRPSCSSSSEFGREQIMEVDYARVYEI